MIDHCWFALLSYKAQCPIHFGTTIIVVGGGDFFLMEIVTCLLQRNKDLLLVYLHLF